MAELSETLLKYLENREGFDTLDAAKELGVDHQKVVGAVKSIQSAGDVRYTSNFVISAVPCLIL